MPSRKEIQWSQLRVGVLVVTAMAVLVGLIILMSGSTGGLFARKLVLRSYFLNAAGLKDGLRRTRDAGRTRLELATACNPSSGWQEHEPYQNHGQRPKAE